MELNAKYFWSVIVVKNYGEQFKGFPLSKGDFDKWIENFEVHRYKFYGTEDEANKKGESLCKENETYFLEYIDVED